MDQHQGHGTAPDHGASFIHLHVHTHYSLGSATLQVEELVAIARRVGLPAVTVTDRGNVHGAVELCLAARAAGLKPIVGCDLLVEPGSLRNGWTEDRPCRLTVLCRDLTGYRNLVSLLACSGEGGSPPEPVVPRDALLRFGAGLTALAGGLDGEIPRALAAGRRDEAADALAALRAAFGRDHVYLELRDDGASRERRAAHELAAFGQEKDAPLVLTSDVRFAREQDRSALNALHEADDNFSARRPLPLGGVHLRSPDEMCALYPSYPDACTNTVRI